MNDDEKAKLEIDFKKLLKLKSVHQHLLEARKLLKTLLDKAFAYDFTDLEKEIEIVEFFYFDVLKLEEGRMFSYKENEFYNTLHDKIKEANGMITNTLSHIKFEEESHSNQ